MRTANTNLIIRSWQLTGATSITRPRWRGAAVENLSAWPGRHFSRIRLWETGTLLVNLESHSLRPIVSILHIWSRR